MAFFKLRKAGGEQAAPASAPESIDALRKRARYRLAGAVILVLAGVIGFPLLFDNQPRPIAVDIPIEIPDKAKVKPLAATNPVAEARPSESASAPVASTPAAVEPQPAASRAVAGQVASAPAKDSKPASKEADKAADKEEVIIAASKPVSKAAEKAADKPSDKASDKPAAADGRFVVQFGAFSDSAHAHEARLKVEKAGLKTYAQVVDGPDGKKFRVRVGPFAQRSEAEKAAEKIKKLDLPATILGL